MSSTGSRNDGTSPSPSSSRSHDALVGGWDDSDKRPCVRLQPTGMRFITGLSSAYEDDFPPELMGLIKEDEFEAAINQINNTLTDYWPCYFCFCCGYACCVCTAGLSFLCPNLCISDAESYARTLMERINHRTCFKEAGVHWKLVKSYGKSWIEISYPNSPSLNKSPIIGTYQTILASEPRSGITTATYGSRLTGEEYPQAII